MKNLRELYTFLATIVLLAASGPPATALGQTNEGSKILFLHLQVQKDKSVKLLDSVTRPGELKPPANTEIHGGIHYELIDADGKSLWHAAIADPSERIIEHGDPSRSGKLKQMRVELPEAEFSIRVPVKTNAVRLEFYRWSNASTNKLAGKIRLGVWSLPLK